MLRKKKEEGRGAGKDFAGNPGCRPEVGALLTQGAENTHHNVHRTGKGA